MTDSLLPFMTFPTFREFPRGQVCQRLMTSDGIIHFLPFKQSPVEFWYIRGGIISTMPPRAAAKYSGFPDRIWSLSRLFLVEKWRGISSRSTPLFSSLLSILPTMDAEQSNPFQYKRTASLSLPRLGVDLSQAEHVLNQGY